MDADEGVGGAEVNACDVCHVLPSRARRVWLTASEDTFILDFLCLCHSPQNCVESPDAQQFEGSKRALEKCEAESHELRISWHTLSNLFYILRRDRGAGTTVEFIRHVLSICTVVLVGPADALRAVEFGLNDFEDALQLSAAESFRADVILTRTKTDFGKPPVIPSSRRKSFPNCHDDEADVGFVAECLSHDISLRLTLGRSCAEMSAKQPWPTFSTSQSPRQCACIVRDEVLAVA